MKNMIKRGLIAAIGLMMSLNLMAQTNFECRVENESYPSATTFEFDVRLYATGATTTWEYATGVFYINMNSAFRNAGTITASIVASSSELNAAQVPTSVSYQATNNYVIIAAKTPPGAGGGSIITQSGVRVVRMRLTNTANFSTTAAPNCTFRWATPNTGISAYVGTTNTPIANNTVTAGQAFCLTPVYYSSTSNAWNSTPSVSRDATVYSGTATGTVSSRGLTVATGATLNVGSGNTLTVSRNLTNNGTIDGSGASLVLSGKSSQTVSGSAMTFANVTAGVSGSSSTKTLSTGLTVSGNVELVDATTLASGGNLKLTSTSSGTAKLLALPTGASVTGNVTVERFIYGSSGRRYRYLAAPFASGPSISSSWQQQIHVSGPGTGGSTCPSLSANSNGFDATMTNGASMFTFNESTAVNSGAGSLSGTTVYTNAWTSVPNTSTALSAGTGYNVFVRGNRSQGCALLDGTNPTPADVTLSATGTLQTGSTNLTVSYNAANGEGWNLVGNPYASPINWDASGWTKTNIDNSVWIYRPAGNHYASWNSALGVGTNFGTSVIESGNAFFVKANGASPALSLTESSKSATSATGNMFKTNAKVLRALFVKRGELQDEAIVAISPNASNGVDEMDSEKMSNPSLNIYSVSEAAKKNAINTIAEVASQTIIPLGIGTTFTGTHEISFKGENEFAAYDVLLEDKYAGTITLINEKARYSFEVTSDLNSKGEGRFYLIFVNRGDVNYLKNIQGVYKGIVGTVNMYPNPTNGVTKVSATELTGSNAQVKLYNALGQEVASFSKEISNGSVSFDMDLSNNNSGVYFVEVSDASGKVTKGKLVRN
jgi:hypothetical protein